VIEILGFYLIICYVEVSEFTQYFGIASYGSKIALNRLNAPHVLVSYTSDVEPWEEIDTLMVDSGGYSLCRTNRTEYETSDREYLDYLDKHDAEYAMLRDYPLSSDPDARVSELQDRTTNHQLKLLDNWNISTKPVAVVQGHSPRQYRQHTSKLRDAGITTEVDWVAIGSLVGKDTAEKFRIVTTVDDALPDEINIHGLGVQVSDLTVCPKLASLLATADSNAWDYTTGGMWREKAYAYLSRRRKLAEVSIRDNQRRFST
jgi:hypothetical protein